MIAAATAITWPGVLVGSIVGALIVLIFSRRGI